MCAISICRRIKMLRASSACAGIITMESYDQGYIATLDLLRAEEIWIENRRRPKPHARDVALMKRVVGGAVVPHSVWTERRVARRAVVGPDY
jgi:hypothetical protein